MLENHDYEITRDHAPWADITAKSAEYVLAKFPTLCTTPTKRACEVPIHIRALPPRMILTRRLYVKMGCCLALSGWSRRAIPNELQLRMDCYLDAGGKYLDPKGKKLPIHEDSLDEVLGDDPGYKWLSDWPRRALSGDVRQTPHKRLLERLTLINLALRTPLVNLAA